MDLPNCFGEQKFKDKKKEELVRPVSKIKDLESLIIKKIGKVVENLEETKSGPIDNLSPVDRYDLTLKNIQRSIFADYKDKKSEEWLDIYLIEYKKKEQMKKDILRLRLKQEDLEEESLRFLVRDNYVVLINIYSEDLDKSADKIFKFYKKRFGMKEVDVTYTFK